MIGFATVTGTRGTTYYDGVIMMEFEYILAKNISLSKENKNIQP